MHTAQGHWWFVRPFATSGIYLLSLLLHVIERFFFFLALRKFPTGIKLSERKSPEEVYTARLLLVTAD